VLNVVGGDVIIGEDEYAMITKCKELKQQYREKFDQFKKIKSDVDYCKRVVDQCRQKLMTEFETWFEAMYGNLVIADSSLPSAPQNMDLNEQEVSFQQIIYGLYDYLLI
jgi:kinesin family protein 6/9